MKYLENKLNEDALDIFARLLIDTIKRDFKINQSRIAKSIGIHTSLLTKVKYNYYKQSKTQYKVLYNIIEFYQIDYTLFIEEANNESIKRKKNKEEEKRRNGMFKLIGITSIPEKNDLLIANVNIQLYDNTVSLITKEKLEFQGQLWHKKNTQRYIELKDISNSKIDIIISFRYHYIKTLLERRFIEEKS